MRQLCSFLRLASLFLLLTTAFLSAHVSAQDKLSSELTSTSLDCSKLLELDTELRQAFAKTGRDKLPEARRKPLPRADVAFFDWVHYLGLTPVVHQGNKPNCIAHATIAALQWNWQIRNGGSTKILLSPQPILDRLQKRDFYNIEPLWVLLTYGTATLNDYPYTGEPGPLRTRVATPYRIVGWGGYSLEPEVDKLKQALLEHGPLVASVYTTPAFKAYKGGVFAEHFHQIPKDNTTDHAVVILGWDDRLGKKGCWHIQNSWGLQWGEGGGGWIEYGCNNIGCSSFWIQAQSIHYNLPADAHRLLGDKAAPFRAWAKDRPSNDKPIAENGAKRPPADSDLPQGKPIDSSANVADPEVSRLTAALIKAPAAEQNEIITSYQESKGVVYTSALAVAIRQLDGEVKTKARDALAERLVRMTAATLREKLKDEDTEVRSAAALACGMRKETQFVADLIPLLEDSDRRVTRAAHVALKTVTGKDFGPARDAWKRWWQKNKGD